MKTVCLFALLALIATTSNAVILRGTPTPQRLVEQVSFVN